jgi:RimJ/RimL family protein N-acetyltransferase
MLLVLDDGGERNLKRMDSLEIPILSTERLRLRPFRRSDFDDYAAMYSDPEVLRYLGGGPEPWDRGRSWRHMAFQLGHWQLGDRGMWALEQRETGTFLGGVGFADPEGWPGLELAWTLARRWWGHGYATEGARAALAHAFDVWQRDRVISLIHPENRASIRVAERLGERLQGRIQHFGREMLCYGIDREGYRDRQPRMLFVSGPLRTVDVPPSSRSACAGLTVK